MRQLLLVVLAVMLASCMKVSDLTAETEYHLRDIGLLNYTELKRANTWRLQDDSYIYISQGHFVPLGHPSAQPNIVAQESFNAFIEYFPRLSRSPTPLGYEEALSAWLLAYQLSGRTALLYNLAQAYSRLGMLEEEKATLEAFLSDTDEGAVNETLTQSATERLEAIVDRLERTRLEIVGSLDDAEIFLNEEYIGRLPLDGPIKVSPTTHRISGRAEGFADAVATVSMRPGMTSRVELHFEALEITSERKMKKLPLSLLISGASVAAVGAVVGGLAYGQANGAGINTPEGDRALRMARGADTLLAVGAATFISGIITHIVQKKRASADDDEISIAPSADGLTLGYGRRF